MKSKPPSPAVFFLCAYATPAVQNYASHSFFPANCPPLHKVSGKFSLFTHESREEAYTKGTGMWGQGLLHTTARGKRKVHNPVCRTVPPTFAKTPLGLALSAFSLAHREYVETARTASSSVVAHHRRYAGVDLLQCLDEMVGEGVENEHGEEGEDGEEGERGGGEEGEEGDRGGGGGVGDGGENNDDSSVEVVE